MRSVVVVLPYRAFSRCSVSTYQADTYGIDVGNDSDVPRPRRGGV